MDIRSLYIDFFEKRSHVKIESAPLVLKDDPTTLFTSSGMQPLIPYLLGKKHSNGTKLVNAQPCFRADDWDEIGDNRHTTFFEMLGNWSLGDYWKEEQLAWFFEFLTDVVGLNPQKLYVTYFSGSTKYKLNSDNESAKIWQELFAGKKIKAEIIDLESETNAAAIGLQNNQRIIGYYEKNWWNRGKPSPENTPIGDPCGPDSEVFYLFEDVVHNKKFGENCHPNCDCGRFLEIGNSVFMEYMKNSDGSFSKLKNKNVDFGGGLSRIMAAQKDNPDIFLTDLYLSIIEFLKKVTGKEYTDFVPEFRTIADHSTAAVFMVGEGVLPSNKLQGYILRRLIRKVIVKKHALGVKENIFKELISIIASIYQQSYPFIAQKKQDILKVILEEEKKFSTALKNGNRQIEKIIKQNKTVTGKDIFNLYQSFGFPLEISLEILSANNIVLTNVEINNFETLLKEHQEQSATASKGLFKGGLETKSDQTIKLHTATHLLHAGLRKVLGPDALQKGSNITNERLRFDFSFNRSMSDEEKESVENFVNEIISKDIPVTQVTTSLKEAKKSGALGLFEGKYEDKVSVYSIGLYSKEICGGPHVERTGQLSRFKIVSEKSSSSGIRRIKAILV